MIVPAGMRQHYHQITSYERHLLERWLREGVALAEIGRRLGRSTSTISRELQRNGPRWRKKSYRADPAQRRWEKRRTKSVKRTRMEDIKVHQYVTTKLREGWSPELIAGRMREEKLGSISYETIYRWIYRGGRVYRSCLVRHHTRRKRQGSGHQRRQFNIPHRVGIEDRPEIVAQRGEAGHWEVDTAFFHHCREVMLVMAERKTRYTLLAKMNDPTAMEMQHTMLKRQQPTPRHLRKSFTYDNGRENVAHVYVNTCFGSRSYFCHPGQSWEKGTVENTIGILRRKLPRTAPFQSLSNNDLKTIESWLNNRPRKCLHFKTPKEAYLLERCT